MKKILIIDDEKNIRVSLTALLEDEGYQVFNASSGEEGIEKFKNGRPDAIFLDIWLPGIDGLETLRNILQIDPIQIVIMISGHGNINTAVSAVKEGAYDFLEKPLNLDKVIYTLQRGLSYRKVLEENRKLKSILDEQQARLGEEAGGAKSWRADTVKFDDHEFQHQKKQRTIRESSVFYGIGLHSGEKTGMVINPLPPGKGIRFENISESGSLPAQIAYLKTSDYATTIKEGPIEARTIEHFMATLHAFGITNLAIKINKEVPIDDGSASRFCELIKKCGVEEQDAFVPEIVIDQPLLIGEENADGKFIKIEPSETFSVNYTLVYPAPLGTIRAEFDLISAEHFEKEIAPARTFGFVEEFGKLSKLGLAEGGRMNNIILIDNGRVLNTRLRFKDELARHKILDIIGDFYLLNKPIRGRITAQKTGHYENAQLLKLIQDTYT